MSLSPNAAPAGAKKLMLALMGAAGLVLVGGGGLLFALNSETTSKQTIAQQKEKEVSGSEQIAQRYQTTLDSYNDTQSRIKFLETSVSAKSYIPTLLGQLQTLATATNLTVTAVRPAPPAPPPAPAAKPAGGDSSAAADAKKAPPPPPYDAVNIDVDVVGSYSDTARFLYSLTRFPKIISLAGAQMRPNAGAPGTAPTVTTNLKLVAFMFHDDNADSTVSAPGSPVSTASVVPPPGDLMGHADVSSISAAAGRAERGAVNASRATNERLAAGNSVL